MLAFDMLYDALMRFALRTVEMNLVPDFLLRRGIRFLLAQRLRELKAPNGEEQQRRLVVRARARYFPFCLRIAMHCMRAWDESERTAALRWRLRSRLRVCPPWQGVCAASDSRSLPCRSAGVCC
jgi:hypothetical protein